MNLSGRDVEHYHFGPSDINDVTWDSGGWTTDGDVFEGIGEGSFGPDINWDLYWALSFSIYIPAHVPTPTYNSNTLLYAVGPNVGEQFANEYCYVQHQWTGLEYNQFFLDWKSTEEPLILDDWNHIYFIGYGKYYYQLWVNGSIALMARRASSGQYEPTGPLRFQMLASGLGTYSHVPKMSAIDVWTTRFLETT